jgi:ABC-2 type transport system permease protein
MIGTPASSRVILFRLGWAIADAWVITLRDLAHWVRQPGAVIANTLLFPIMIVLMFGYLLGGAMTVPGGGDYRDFLMPGMFAMTMVFGIGATLAAVSADAARGVTDRFRSMPMATSAVITGRAAADMLNSAAALAVLAGCGLLAGWHPHRGAVHALGAFGLLLLLRFAFLWIGVYLGLTFYPNPEAVTAVRTLEFPIGFLGNPFGCGMAWMRGGDDPACPRPGAGDLEGSAASAADEAGGGVQEAVASSAPLSRGCRRGR